MAVGYKKYFKIILLVAVIGLGIFLRTYAYLQNCSFWCDEGFLMVNLNKLHYLDFFNRLPEFNQVAPPFFLIASKFLATTFGYKELVVRFIPYVSAVLSVVLFYKLTDKIFSNDISKIVSIFMFSVCPAAVIMSQNFKQYSSDLFFSVVAFLLILKFDEENFSNKKAFLFGLFAGVSIYFSYSLLFIIGAFVFLLLFKIFIKKKKYIINYLLIFLVPTAISFLIYFYHYFKQNINDKFLFNYWDTTYGYYPLTFMEFSRRISYFYDNNFLLRSAPYLILSLLIIGGVILFWKNKSNFILLFTPIILTYILGYIELYPFADRLILFLLPAFIIIICMSLELVNTKRKLLSSIIIFPYIYLCLATNIFNYYKDVLNGKNSFAITRFREFYNTVVSRMGPNDLIFINGIDATMFHVYNMDGQIPEKNIFFDHFNEKDMGLPKISKSTPHIYFYLNNVFMNTPQTNFIKKWAYKNCSTVSIESLSESNRRISPHKIRTYILTCSRK